MLDELQVQLEAHFKALAEARKPARYPVYAIEHGQSEVIIRSARDAAAKRHNTLGLHRRFWLVWIVLAAEAGYGYDGEEYWPSLETTPGEWRAQNDRQTLRRWFELFHCQYNGPVPEGRWAQHFSIIAWPITGALLPKYLQGHFARHLFQIRYGLSRMADASAEEIGHYLRETSDRRSARYEDFLEQSDLTGRIVLALRDEDLNEPIPRITPTALERIVSDLERRRGAREYLQAARQVLRSARGVVSAPLAGSRRSSPGQATLQEAVQPPRLIARQRGDGRVLLGVRMPDFALAMKNAGLAQQALGQLRVRLCGETDRWSPGAALLSWSNLDRPLAAFPAAGEPVIELDGAPATLRPILHPLTVLEERPVWLLRQGADNAFRHVVGGRVRPSQTYIIVTRAPLPADLVQALSLRTSPTGLEGVNALVFEAPASISQSYRLALQKLGVGYSLRVRVEPAGLSPISNPTFDGASWAAGEDILLRLSADFPALEYMLELDGCSRSRFAAEEAPVYVSLGAMPVGRHTLKVSAAARGASPESGVDATPAIFDFNVFEPRPWTELAAERAGFRVLLEPAHASLEQVLTGHAHVSLYGPSGRRVSWRVETVDVSGHVAGGGALAQILLPMGADGFAPAVKRLKEYSDAIDAAHRVDLVAELGELGRQTLRFPHEVEPLRWSLDPDEQRLRLVDETAHDEAVAVTRVDLTLPAVRREASHADLVAGVDLAPPGALFCAAYKGQRYVAFASVPSLEPLSALSELRLAQDFRTHAPNLTRSIIGLINALQLWHRARPIGRVAALRKTQTLAGLKAELRRNLCGVDWAAWLESAAPQLERAQAGVGGSPGFGSRMRTTAWVEMSWGQIRVEFFRYAQRYKVTGEREIADQAITLAFRPWSFRTPSGSTPAKTIAGLLDNGPLVRGAYLARAATPVARGMLVA